MALQQIGRKSAVVTAVIGLATLAVGCGAARETALNGAPLSVACEPNQRAIVRQVAVNGSLQAQVQCESAFAAARTTASDGETAPVAYAQAPSAQPIAYMQPASYVQPVAYEPLDNTRLVRATYPQQVVTREVAPRMVTRYQPAPERVVVRQPKRSVKKSAVIIGSSAGVGAGLGAAFGGKKGAGIGALLGGGGAAIWDQITRRQK
jgi:hypothetical protein